MPRWELPSAEHCLSDSLKSPSKATGRKYEYFHWLKWALDQNQRLFQRWVFHHTLSCWAHGVAFAWFLFLSRKIQSRLMGELNLGILTPLHYSSFSSKPLKWPLVHMKINYCVMVHAVVVDSVYLHMLSINIAWCLLKEMWAHTQIVLERKSSEDEVCVELSCNFWFDLFRQVPSWDFVVFSLLRTSSSLFVNTSKIFAMHYPVYCFPH